MAPHEQRVVDELDELVTKANALESFLETERFRSLLSRDRVLLTHQCQMGINTQELGLQMKEAMSEKM